MTAVIPVDRLPSATVGFRLSEANALHFGKIIKVSSRAGSFGFTDCVTPAGMAEEMRTSPYGTLCVVAGKTPISQHAIERCWPPKPASADEVAAGFDKTTLVRVGDPDTHPAENGMPREATPAKESGMLAVAEALSPQCDETHVATNEHNASRLPGVVYEKFNDEHPPVLPVVFLTHNRTAVACHCLDALCKRLVYDGRIHWCVSDDRSENGHIEALERVLSLNGVKEYSIMRTSDSKWGLGASMNNGLALSFGLSDVVLTTEDDFLLRTQFDITGMVRDVLSNNVAGIRLAHVDVGRGTAARYTTVKPSAIPGYLMVVGGSDRNIRHRFVFNNQVMLRHRRVYDSIGTYTCNVDPDTMEEDEVEKYNLKYDSGRSSAMPVLYPGMLPVGTLDNGLFVHVGRSVTGHGHHVMDPGYEILNHDRANDMARDSRNPSSILSTVKNVILNDLNYPGRIGNIMMLITQTYMMAIDIGVDMNNVFFRKRVDTYNGWANSSGKKGDRLPDYLMENKDVVRPLLGKLLDDGGFYTLASKNNCIKMRNEINTPVIHGFSKVVRMEKYTGLISSLFYDKEVFEKHRTMFMDYYTENTVALHVRRTDFALLPAAAMATNASVMDIQMTINGLNGKTVVVFSDDIKWCSDNLKPPSDGKIIFHNSPGAPCDDLILMSCFKTIVQTEEISTYSLIAKLLSEDLQKTGKMTW